MRILIIEDDLMIGRSLSRALEDANMFCDWVQDGLSGESAIETGKYTFILLDLGLPKKNGFEILKTIRAKGNKTPLLIVTARDGLDDRVLGLDLGADDYLIKPFGISELMARIRAIMRRNDDLSAQLIGNGEITLNMMTREVTYRGKTIMLPAREFDLLHVLTEKSGRILTRTQIEDLLYARDEDPKSNAVDVLIHYLRKKFDNEIIRNVRGVGWMVRDTPF